MTEDEKLCLEMIDDMCDAYTSNFRGSNFFSDYGIDECRMLIAYAERKRGNNPDTATYAAWDGISKLAAGCLSDFRDLEEMNEE